MYRIKSAGMFLAVFFCCGTALSAAEELTVARGETLELAASAEYATVTVSGRLIIPADVQLNAGTLVLGPNSGDTAVVEVLGSKERALKVSSMTVGSSGGTGKIVALSADAVHNTGWDEIRVVDIGNVTISKSTPASPSGYIDFLSVGPGTVDFITMTNESSFPARILVDDGCLGFVQRWGVTMFVGPFCIESDNGGDIRFGSHYGHRVLNSGSVTIKGNGRDVYFCRYADDGNQFYLLQSGLVWENVRNVHIVERHPVHLAADNLLPYGPSAGGVVLGSDSETIRLNIGKTVQHLNFFSSDRDLGKASLVGEAGSSVVFGYGDTDGWIKGRIADEVAVVKTGAGALSITNAAQVGTLTVSEGSVSIKVPFTAQRVSVAEGAKLEIDGVVFAPESGIADIRGELVLKNGGRLETFKTVDEDVRIAGYGNSGHWTKEGSGTLVMENPLNMPTNIHVKAGMLTFSDAAGYRYDLYKWSVTAWKYTGQSDSNNGATGRNFYLAELAFVSPQGERIGANSISTSPVGTPPENLQPGQAAFAEGMTLIATGGGGGPGRLFVNNHWPRVGIESPIPSEETPVVLYVRLPENSGPVAAINFAKAWGGMPDAWTLHGSLDGGKTWQLLNAVAGNALSTDDESWVGGVKYTENTGVPKAYPFSNASLEWLSAGVTGMPDAIGIEVDVGAVADFTNVVGGQTVDTLTVDAARGFGTIRNVRFAESGSLYLKNVPEGTSLPDVVVPFTADGMSGSWRLKGWKIYINGTLQREGRYTAVIKAGKMSFRRSGMVLSVR